MNFYAHTLPLPDGTVAPKEKWEPLFSPFGDGPTDCHGNSCVKCEKLQPDHGHLNKVAYWAGRFAANMFSEPAEQDAVRSWARLIGLWHDLGKFSNEFQERLRGTRPRAEHSTAGAFHATDSYPAIGQLIAYIIAGHHAGLADWTGNASKADLFYRIQKHHSGIWHSNVPEQLLTAHPLPPLPFKNGINKQGIAFFTRLLFSCLVDADFLATEAFMSPSKAEKRPEWPKNLFTKMEESLRNHYVSFPPSSTNPINQWRETVRKDCLSAAESSQGLFTLTVPTGGGKTLSSLSFAIRHAQKHHLRRIIYVIPFTSIIEQNAAEFRKALQTFIEKLPAELQTSAVLEHHSNFEPADKDPESDENPIYRLTAENWDAPLIVTTSVQFFESLYANRTSRCRKLHNIARSVIILDEAQNLPVNLLAPCLEMFRQLPSLANCSIVLCTATQPAVGKRPDPENPFNKIALDLPTDREIIRDVPTLFNALKRVSIKIKTTEFTDETLAENISSHSRILCIVNTRAHAARLFELLETGDPANLHLSAQLCPAHRQKVLEEIHRREANGSPCRLVATTVVEAGVNLDFPIVYRAITGLDSIAQAAGRCNRHGKLTDHAGNPAHGKVILFRPADRKPPRFLTSNINSAEQILDDYEDLLSPEAIEHYFNLHYWMNGGLNGSNWDQEKILACFDIDNSEKTFPFLFQYKTAAQSFQMIPDLQMPIIIPPVQNLWENQDEEQSAEICKLLDKIRISHQQKYSPPSGAHRRLQRYTVQIHRPLYNEMIQNGSIQLYHDRFAILTHPENKYHPQLGLHTGAKFDNPESFIS